MATACGEGVGGIRLLLVLANVPAGVCLLALAAACPAGGGPALAWVLLSAAGTLAASGGATWLVARRALRAGEEWRRAREAVEATDRARFAFLTSASHEIRTPLHGVLGAAELLAESPLDPAQLRQLRCLQVSAERLRRLLDGVLTHSQLEAGAVRPEPGPLALRPLLARTMAPLLQQARQQGVALDWCVAEAVPEHLVGDAVRLGQVLAGLAAHAVESAGQGAVRLTVEPAEGRQDEGACRLRFAVRGCPPPDEDGGTAGLGLGVCRQLVALLGGEWGASEFSLGFGLGRPPTPATTPRGGVLLLLGEPGEREHWEALLARSGCRPTVLGSGQEGLDAVVRAVVGGAPYSLVLVGECLPDLAAHEVIRNLVGLAGFIGRTVLLRRGARPDSEGHPPVPAGVAVLESPVGPEQLAGLLGAVDAVPA